MEKGNSRTIHEKFFQTLVTKIFSLKIGVLPVIMNSFFKFKESGYNLRNKSCLETENVSSVNGVGDRILNAS